MNKATALALLEEKANEIWKPLYEYKIMLFQIMVE